MRPASIALLSLLCTVPRSQAQDANATHSLFGCSESAVEVDVSKKPSLRIVPVAGAPARVGREHAFRFPALGPLLVNIYFYATIPEDGVGNIGRLEIYVQTIDAANDAQSKRGQWWEVAGDENVSAFPSKSSSGLTFDTNRIASCFDQDTDCSFADIALATPDPNVPIVAIKFGENLGGANASNWTEASVLLDFRATPPRVAATADCAYNEGGGACTALDSGEMFRSGLDCDWAAKSQDFLCSETSDPYGYRDFFLLSDKPGPPRPGEVATLADAVREFRSKGTDKPVKVHGIGPVTWIGEVPLKYEIKMIVLGSVGHFHLVPESGTLLAFPIEVTAHPLIVDPDEPSHASTRIDIPGWTGVEAHAFRFREIYREKDLIAIQIVEDVAPDSRDLYWLGIEGEGSDLKFDAVQLTGGARYGSCGKSVVPENVVSIGTIAKPFSAQVQIQPATWFSDYDDSQRGWEAPDEESDVTNCIRNGSVTWVKGKFAGTMDDSKCVSTEQPKDIRVDPDGKISVKEFAVKPGR